MLIEGFCASQIAKKLQKSKGYISKIISALEKGGFVLCINPHERPQFYTATKKKFIRGKFPDLIPSKKSRTSHRLEMVEIQKSSFICQILSKPTRPTWDSIYTWKPGVDVYQYSHPFKDFGVVRFRRFRSNNNDKLLIILPRLLLHKNQVNKAEELLIDYALKSAGWIKKRFNMPVSIPQMCQKPHYAVPCREPEVVQALQKKSFKIGEMIADTSPPDLLPEIESTDSRDVVNYLDGINKIKWIEDKLLNNEKLIMELMSKVDMMTNNQTAIVSTMSKLFLNGNLKEDTFMDVV